MTLPSPEFLLFPDFVKQSGYNEDYIHLLISQGSLVPFVFLTDLEQLPGGKCSGGNFVGDIEFAKIENYEETYVSFDPHTATYFEHWPEYHQRAFLHAPTTFGNHDYEFSFFSESPDASQVKTWFYLQGNKCFRKTDAAKRFCFLMDEVNTDTAELSTQSNSISSAASSGLLVTSGIPLQKATSADEFISRTVHKLRSRSRLLEYEIELAIQAAGSEKAEAVWSELIKLAERGKGCLISMDEAEIKYRADDKVKWFKKKNLRDRLSRRKNLLKLVSTR